MKASAYQRGTACKSPSMMIPRSPVSVDMAMRARPKAALCRAEWRNPTLPAQKAAATATAMTAAIAARLAQPHLAEAAEAKELGTFEASGVLPFNKDQVEVVKVDDPSIPVTLYLSDFKRSLSSKLSRDFFSEPSQASLSCALTDTLANVPPKIANSGSEGEELFSQRKGGGLLGAGKVLRIRRLYDSERKVAIYVSYSSRLASNENKENVSPGRYKTSTCAVPLAPSLTGPHNSSTSSGVKSRPSRLGRSRDQQEQQQQDESQSTDEDVAVPTAKSGIKLSSS